MEREGSEICIFKQKEVLKFYFQKCSLIKSIFIVLLVKDFMIICNRYLFNLMENFMLKVVYRFQELFLVVDCFGRVVMSGKYKGYKDKVFVFQ